MTVMAPERRSLCEPIDVTIDSADDRTLFRLVHSEDLPTRDRAIEILTQRYDWVVRRAATRYRGRGENPEDLQQVGYVGLVLAIQRFDPDRGTDFPAFARPTVQGEIRRHFRDRRRWIQLPRRLQELKAVVSAAGEELTQQLGRAPSPSEIAEYTGRPLSDIEEAVAADDTFAVDSLDAPLDPDSPESTVRADLLAQEDSGFAHVTDRETIWPLIRQLPECERRVLLLRFFGDRTQSQIGAEIGVSQMQVSRLLRRTLARLRRQALQGQPAMS